MEQPNIFFTKTFPRLGAFAVLSGVFLWLEKIASPVGTLLIVCLIMAEDWEVTKKLRTIHANINNDMHGHVPQLLAYYVGTSEKVRK